jgi:hypothetical protein
MKSHDAAASLQRVGPVIVAEFNPSCRTQVWIAVRHRDAQSVIVRRVMHGRGESMRALLVMFIGAAEAECVDVKYYTAHCLDLALDRLH